MSEPGGEVGAPKVARRKDVGVSRTVQRRFLAAVQADGGYLESLYDQLKSKDGGLRDGTGYSLTHDNTLKRGWVAQTPPGLWGKPAREAKVGAGRFLVSRIERLVASAETFVDITTLYPFPDGRFLGGIKRGLTAVARSGRHVRVRVLAGYYPSVLAKQKDYLAALIEPLKAIPDGKLEIYVAAQRTTPLSWNHAKIVAVDGKRAIVGGENLWTGDYLELAPVHDLNVDLTGSAAFHMHRFADEIWGTVCKYWEPGWKPAYWKSGASKITTKCLAACGLTPTPGRGQLSVLGVGRFGPLLKKQSNPADTAMLLALGSAESVIRIAQQDLAFSLLYWKPGMQAIARALLRGCDVYIVLSNDHGKSGGGNKYSTGTVAGTADAIKSYVKAEPDAPKGAKLTALLCDKLHIAGLRFGPSNTWPEPKPYEFANHAKFFMVDDKVVYVGSENLYPSDLIEYGVFISDADAIGEMREQYWDKLWTYSKRVAISGDGEAGCHFS